MDEFKSRLEGLQKAFEGIRMNFKPSMRKFLKNIGNTPIYKISICRRPLSSKFSTIINVINTLTASLTKFKPKTHDQLFHLFLILELIDNKKIILEKNEDLHIEYYNKSNVDEVIDLTSYDPKQNKTINELLNKVIEVYGKERIFEYNAFTTNCQRFVIDILKANNIYIDDNIHNFILQDVKNLVSSWADRLVYKITSFYNRFKMIIQGYGLLDPNYCSFCGGYVYNMKKHINTNNHYLNVLHINYI